MHLIKRTKLVSGETSVTICIAVRRAEIVGKNDTGTEREREKENDIEDKTEPFDAGIFF
jgi:hypothetical protein